MGGATMTPFDERSHSIGRALNDGLHRSIVSIANPAAQAKPVRLLF